MNDPKQLLCIGWLALWPIGILIVVLWRRRMRQIGIDRRQEQSDRLDRKFEAKRAKQQEYDEIMKMLRPIDYSVPKPGYFYVPGKGYVKEK